MNLHERAWQVWPLLAFAASHRQTMTYEILGRLTGMHAAGLGPVLEHLQSYCLIHHLPPLSAIVVNKGTGLPSEGFVAASNVPRAFIQVFEHDWMSRPCPSSDDLAEARRVRPSNGVVTPPVQTGESGFRT